MNDENSIESLYSEALGISDTSNNSISLSSEGFDGFDDALEVEITKSFENLAFLDTYTAMQQKNSAEMIRMCKKLSVNYGLKSGVNEKAAKSIESLCNVYSTEEEKKEGVFQKILAGVKKILKSIGDFFIRIWEKIKQFFIINVGKIDRDLSTDQIKTLVSNEKVWNGAPSLVVTGGSANVAGFNVLVKGVKETAEKAKNASKSDVYVIPCKEIQEVIEEIGKKTPIENIKLEYGVICEEYNENIKTKVAQWAGKASNLKGLIDSIKSSEEAIKSINTLVKLHENLCDKIEKINGDEDTKKESINYVKSYMKVLNLARTSYLNFVKSAIFAKKLYNAGKSS